jgi:GntR family transcriptional repressor for pyruvate dehydrogenase complex
MIQRDDGQPSQLFTAMQRGESLAIRVARELERLIVEGGLAVGKRLPSERELADQFAVSRTVIREAIRTLVAKGLLDVRTGSGTVVREPTAEAAAESMSRLLATRPDRYDYTRVIEVRRVLEVEIAGLAAHRRTSEDIAALKAILTRAEERLGDPDTFVHTDVAFHEALARATHNDLFVVLLSSIAQAMIAVRQLGLRVPGTPARALDYHRRILTCVEAGDVMGARQAMDRHMDEAWQTMSAALSHANLTPAAEGNGA